MKLNDFDEQIRKRFKQDNDIFLDSFVDLSTVIFGRKVMGGTSEDKLMEGAVSEILHYFQISESEITAETSSIDERMEFLLRPTGVMQRKIILSGKWWKDSISPMIAGTADGDVIALIPSSFAGYHYIDKSTGKKRRLTKKTAQTIKSEAVAFIKPLPQKSLSSRDLIIFMMKSISRLDIAVVAAAIFGVTLLGMLLPYANRLIFEVVIPYHSYSLLYPILIMLLSMVTATALINITKSFLVSRIETKIDVTLQAAIIARLISLPTSFFKKWESGELTMRVNVLEELSRILVNTVFSTGLTALFSFVYILQIAGFAPSLAIPALIVILVNIGVTIGISVVQMKVNLKINSADANLSGIVYALIRGIQKIKISGAEIRAFAKWEKAYREKVSSVYNPPLLLKFSSALSAIIVMAGAVLIYYCAAITGISAGIYMAFSAAYGMVSAAVIEFSKIAGSIALVKPMIYMASPVLETVPEIAENKKLISGIDGDILIDNVSFRYNPDSPLVLENISLKIHAGEYIGIVGTTGCGKSTLMRILLGFETPETGAVYYDGNDMKDIDLKSLRRQIGTVLQDGKLFPGDLYSNIVVSAPWLTHDDAWEAARTAGISDDIENMPMGMLTAITPNGGGLSGGQRQRILIARAVAPKPKVLFFDEATSALDNITQKQVSESLAGLKSTRIAIAHRLSTIQHCDRIIVLDNKHVVEEGTYDSLIAKGGFFAKLVARQRVE